MRRPSAVPRRGRLGPNAAGRVASRSLPAGSAPPAAATQRARQDAERLAALRDALVAANEAYWAEQVDIQREVVLAWIARAEGRNEDGIALLRGASDREDATDKHPVTPGPITPARELLGELLLELMPPPRRWPP